MDDRNIHRVKRVTRIQIFGTQNDIDFDLASRTLALFAELVPIMSKLEKARIGQLRGPVGKGGIIAELSDDFKDIARTARAIRLDEPTFPYADFRHPATSVETPVATHADSLLKMLEDNTAPVADGGDTPDQLATKATLRAKFVAYELPADFVEDLRADRDALDACNSGKHSDNLEGVESTSAIETLLGEAQAIITRLDAAIRNKYSRNPDKLAAWKSASRLEKAPKKSATVVSPTPPAN